MSRLISLEDTVLGDRSQIVSHYERVAQAHNPNWSPNPSTPRELIPIIAAVLLDQSQVLSDHLLPQADFLGGSDITNNDVTQALLRSHIDVSKLSEFDIEQLRGALISARGALVEGDVFEKLTSHRLPVPEGTTKIIQNTFTNPGSDFQFLDKNGHVLESMNVKAAKSFETISQHFQHHPDVNVVFATHDAAVAAKQHGMTVVSAHAHDFVTHGQHVVVDIGHTSSWYQEQFLRHTPDFGTFDHHHILNDGFGHGSFLHHFPWITTGVVLYRAARRYRDGMNIADQKRLAGNDVARAGASLTVGGILKAAGMHNPGTVIGTIGTVVAVQGLQNVRESWSELSTSENAITNLAESLV